MKQIVALIAAAFVVGLIFFNINTGRDLEGSDDQALGAISELAPGTMPWFKNVFDPGDKEGLFFLLQIVIGACIFALSAYGLYKSRQNYET